MWNYKELCVCVWTPEARCVRFKFVKMFFFNVLKYRLYFIFFHYRNMYNVLCPLEGSVAHYNMRYSF